MQFLFLTKFIIIYTVLFHLIVFKSYKFIFKLIKLCIAPYFKSYYVSFKFLL